MAIKLTCPRCQSEDIMRCEMAYAQGTTTGTISGRVVGANIGGDGSISPTLGGGSVGTQTQSILAQYAAPPVPPANRFNFGAAIGFLVLGLPAAVAFFLYASANRINFGVTFVLTVVISFAGILVGNFIGSAITSKQGESQQKLKYRQDFADWQKRWICLKCGDQFYL